jgi:hypothetical protein
MNGIASGWPVLVHFQFPLANAAELFVPGANGK